MPTTSFEETKAQILKHVNEALTPEELRDTCSWACFRSKMLVSELSQTTSELTKEELYLIEELATNSAELAI